MSGATITGTLQRGLTIAGQVHKDFELREALAEDLFAAEAEVSADKPLGFRNALLARQLVRLGTYTGPFTPAMLGKLSTADFGVLTAKQTELDTLGEDGQPG